YLIVVVRGVGVIGRIIEGSRYLPAVIIKIPDVPVNGNTAGYCNGGAKFYRDTNATVICCEVNGRYIKDCKGYIGGVTTAVAVAEDVSYVVCADGCGSRIKCRQPVIARLKRRIIVIT